MLQTMSTRSAAKSFCYLCQCCLCLQDARQYLHHKQLQPGQTSQNVLWLFQVLVGNKCDMDESKRVVPYSKGQALADEFGIQFFETSAKSNLKVDEVQNLTAIQCCCSCFVCSSCIMLICIPVLHWGEAIVLCGRPYASVPFHKTGAITQPSAGQLFILCPCKIPFHLRACRCFNL